MDPSRRIRTVLRCPAGHEFHADIWSVVDLEAHAALRSDRTELLSTPCATCDAPTTLASPLLLLNPLADVPAVSVDGWASSDLDNRGLVDLDGRARVARALGIPASPPPGIVLTTTRQAIPLLLACTSRTELRERAAQEAVTGSPFAAACRDLCRTLDELATAQVAMTALGSLGDDVPIEELPDAVHRLNLVGNTAVLEYIESNAPELAALDADVRFFAQRRRFVEQVVSGEDPKHARELLADAMEAVLTNALRPEFDAALHAVAEAMGRAGPDRLPLLGRAIDLAQTVQQSNIEAFLRAERAFLLTGNSATIWAADVARLAEHDLRRAVELTATTGDRDLQSRASMNLATILGNKGSGDRSENLEEAIGLIRGCLESSSEQSEPDYWAMYCTNLSVLYVNRRRGDRAENLREAERLCQAALRVRSIERDPVDWAYTATNLAFALIARARIGDGAPPDLLDRALLLGEQAAAASTGVEYLAAGALQNAAAAARAHIQAALDEQARRAAEAVLPDPEVASALRRSGLATGSAADRVVLIARLAKENPRAAGFASTPGWTAAITDPVLSESDRQLLDRAMELSARARSIRARSPGVDLAMSCKQWDDLLLLAGAPSRDRAEVLEEGLALLAVDDLPGQVLEIADRLGALYSEDQEWARAADAYATAVAALDWIYQELSGQKSRMVELTTNYKLVELAVYAMAMAGRANEAVLLLENGRTRELGADVARDSAAMARLRVIAPALVAELQQVQRQLSDIGRWDADEGAPEPSPGPGRAPSRVLRQELQHVIDRIRGIDGFADFMTGVSAREVAAVSRRDQPLAYLVASPVGSLALLVKPGDAGTGAAALDVTVLRSEVTSAQLVRCVSRVGPDGPTGVLIASGEDLDVEIGHAQELLGAAFGQNLFDVLSTTGATGVRLVATGILATLPVNTAQVVGPDGPQPLSELLTVTLVPSAHVHQVCRERMQQRARRSRLLVCASDPEADDRSRALPFSRSEVRAIGKLYGAQHSRVREGAAATKAFLVENAGQASHLHLSLHGFSDVADAMRSGVVMADGPMTVAEFRESAELTAQVVVVSACESGRISIRDAPNEFRGLPFGLIGCGAASVVASLWPVNDLATSLLMVRFHEVLLDLEDTNPVAPDLVAQALRAAQAWLRSATDDDVQQFMTQHDLFPGRADGDAQERGLRQLLTKLAHRDPPKRHPFGAARHWASFVAIG